MRVECLEYSHPYSYPPTIEDKKNGKGGGRNANGMKWRERVGERKEGKGIGIGLYSMGVALDQQVPTTSSCQQKRRTLSQLLQCISINVYSSCTPPLSSQHHRPVTTRLVYTFVRFIRHRHDIDNSYTHKTMLRLLLYCSASLPWPTPVV